MSIRSIDVNSADFHAGGKYMTNDGKIITLKHFCVETPEAAPTPTGGVLLSSMQIGQKARTRSGEIVTLKKVCGQDTYPYVFIAPGGELYCCKPQGYYWSQNMQSRHDIIEILPLEGVKPESELSLEGIRPGQKVRTKAGNVLTFCRKTTYHSQWPYLFGDGLLSYTPSGVYRSDFLPGPDDIVEILPYDEEPRVQIDRSTLRKGDIFRLRNGRQFVYSGYEFSGRFKGNCEPEYECGYLYFNPDGTCPNRDAGHEVVEVITAPLVSLAGVQIGSTFRTRSGLVRVLEHSNYRGQGEFYGRPFHGSDGPGGFYKSDGSSSSSEEYDAVEILSPPKVPCVQIDGAKKGDEFRLRCEKVYVHNGVVSGAGLLQAVRAGELLYFRPDGTCPNRKADHDVIAVSPAPMVSIEDANVGDVFRLRNGKEFECVDTTSKHGFYQGKLKDPSVERTLWFRLDGHCPAWEDDYDVIEVVPASPPTLIDKVIAQVAAAKRGSIDQIVISSKDYDDHSEDLKARLRDLQSPTLRYSHQIAAGKFEIRFK